MPTTPHSHDTRETILLAEDNDTIRRLVLRILRAEGHTVLEAASVEEALRINEQYGGDIGILLSDVVMPDMSGRTLRDSIAARRPSIRVLFMSGFAKHDVIALGVDASDVTFLHKPFTPAQLINAVRECSQRGGTARPATS